MPLTIFLRPTDGAFAVHDALAIAIDSGHHRLAEDPRCFEAHVMVVDRVVHLPGEVVGEVELVRRVARGELVELSVAHPDRAGGGIDLERRMLKLVLEEVGAACGGNVLGALGHVGGGGVSQDPFAHVLLREAGHTQPPTAHGILELLALLVPNWREF